IFRGISELMPVRWSENIADGLPVLVPLWALAVLWRAVRGKFDLAETLTCIGFTWLGLTSQRFLGFYALVAAPYVARSLDAAVRVLPWPPWTSPPAARAALAALACVAIGIPEWLLADRPLGVARD